MARGAVAGGAWLTKVVDRLQKLGRWQRYLVAFAAGVCSILAFAPFFFSPVLFATLPVLLWLSLPEPDSPLTNDERRTLRRLYAAKLGRGFAIGWWFGFGFHLAGLYWIGGAFLVQADVFGWLLPFAVTLMPAGLAIFHGLALSAVGCFTRGPVLRVLALSVALFVSEWLRGNILTGFPWNVLGYALTYPLSLMQSAAVLGIYGLTLVTVIVFATPLAVLAGVRDRQGAGRAVRVIALATLGPLALMAGYGWLALTAPDAGIVSGVKLRLVQPSIVQADKFLPEKRREILERHIDLSRNGSPGGSGTSIGEGGFGDVTHVIWPEAALPFLALRTPEVAKRVAEVFPDNVTLIAGTLRLDGPLIRDGRKLKVYNTAFVMGGDGRKLNTYDKVHLVPFGEYLPFQDTLEAIGLEQITRVRGGFATGVEPRPLLNVRGLPPVAMLICYEIVFPEEIVVGPHRPGLMMNLTNDAWYGRSTGPYQHFHQSRARAVEQGIPLVRVGNNGITATIDARGRVLAQLGLDAVGAITTALPRPIEPTTYALYGDIPAWIVAIMLALFISTVSCGKICRNF